MDCNKTFKKLGLNRQETGKKWTNGRVSDQRRRIGPLPPHTGSDGTPGSIFKFQIFSIFGISPIFQVPRSEKVNKTPGGLSSGEGKDASAARGATYHPYLTTSWSCKVRSDSSSVLTRRKKIVDS
jgi:hypothetical protein